MLFDHCERMPVLAVALFVACQAVAQSYSTNFDALSPGASILTSTSGAGQWVDATGGSSATVSNSAGTYQNITLTNYVVFQGDISNLFTRVQPDSSGSVMAQVLAQVVWCDSGLPDSTLCPNRQGGVCISNGYAYAWSTNGWLQLTNRLDARQTITSNTWTKFTFSANYSDNSIVYYKVYVDGTNFVPVDATQRYVYAGTSFSPSTTGSYVQSSATFASTNKGISGFYLAGNGALDLPSVTPAGSFTPTSAGIAIRAYLGSDAQGNSVVYVDFMSQGEEDTGTFYVTVLDAAGNVVWTGEVAAIGSGNHLYRLPVSGLTVGAKYTIQITDEVGKNWTASNITVGSFATSMVQMSAMGLNIQFTTIPDRHYDIQWTPKLGADWITAITNLYALGSSTNVFVFYPDRTASSGFVRILMH